MIFKIENLGLIKQAEVNLDKDLILLCGHNNTGKSYLAYEIYQFLSLQEGVRAGVMKIRFQPLLKVDPSFIPPRKNNKLRVGFSLTIHNSQFTIHNFHQPRFVLT